MENIDPTSSSRSSDSAHNTSPIPVSLHALYGPTWSVESSVVALFLHGYGSHEHDVTALAPSIPPHIPWASLQAPVAMGGGGYAWFPISDLDAIDTSPVQASTAAIWSWVEAELPAETCVLPIGFSQGGFMATQLLRTRPDRVISPVILSGFINPTPQPGDRHLATQKPRIFWGRGSTDPIIQATAVTRTAAWAAQYTTATVKVYSGLAHGVSGEELQDVAEFLGETVTN